MTIYGKRFGVYSQILPKFMLTEAIPGQIYEIQVRTKGIPDPKGAVSLLTKEIPKKFKAEVIWVRVLDDIINFQIVGSPFAWSAFLAYLPELLSLVGIIVTLIAIYLVWATTPGWVVGLLLVGLALVWLSGYIGERLSALVALPEVSE